MCVYSLGMELVRESLEEYLTELEISELEPSYEGWIAKLHPDNVKTSFVSEYDLGEESDDDDVEIHGTALNDLQKVAHKRRQDMCCVDFRFYSPASDHLQMWNQHPRVAEAYKIVVNIEAAETANIADAEVVTRKLTQSLDSDEEVNELWEWSSEDEQAVTGDSLKAFDLRADALEKLKDYVTALDVVKTDCEL